ncbi:MAG: CDGSH iron-sulfur domain-containing protein [Calditrichaeota bacterium]|nr:MAG: CDGSH iron-sulfur domain-containing protein [Calditrichota bacterium]
MVKITAKENGPYIVEGDGTYMVVKDGKEEPIEQKAIALCRCGASGNKPFCDGSHKNVEFSAEGTELKVQ